MVGTTLLHYEITEKIGAGGMGEVYRAKDTKLGRDVALKILPAAFGDDGERLGRFEREARVLASLNHPQIASIHGLEQADSTRFLVLEYVDGEDLAQRINRGPLPLSDVVDIARQVAEALEEAHERGIIHRDLKPANIKLTADGKVKVLDFGLAKALEGDAAAASSDPSLSNSPTLMASGTVQGVILGTAAYMSPEQARGKPVDRRTDVWAFGCVLFEMLAGRQLFTGETVSDTLAAVLRADPAFDTLPNSTPRGIRRLLKRCLERDRARRLQAIGEARIILEDVAVGNDTTEDDVRAPQPAWQKLLPWGITAAAVIAALIMMSRGGAPPNVAPQKLVTHIEAPPGVSVNTAAHSIALSPDGTQLVFVGDNVSTDGQRQLFLRRLDEADARPLTDTEGARTPFWSPDSRHVGFHASNRLQRIDVTGGRPQVIAQTDGSGGAWREDGTIVFASSGESGTLMRVAASGGAVEEWLDAFPDNARESPEQPLFLPGGKKLLFTIEDYVGETSGIYAVDYETSEVTLLVPGLSNVDYAPPGFILYTQGEDLYAHRFDHETLKLSGQPVRVAGDVQKSNYPFHGFFSCSRSGHLVYLPGSGASAVTELVWADRDGNQIGEPIVQGDLYNQRLSHDERRVAIDISDAARTHGDIWVFDLARGSSVRLTEDPADESRPVWALDDSELYFYRGSQFLRQAVSSAAEPRIIYTDEGSVSPFHLSPDGKYIVFSKNTQNNLWILDVEKGETWAWTSADYVEGEAMFSPDGRWLAYESTESGQYEVYVERFPGREERFVVSVAGGSQPVWRGDGRELFYYSLSGEIMAVPVDMDATDRSPIGKPVALFSTRLRRDDFAVTKDGQRFLLNRPLDREAQTSMVLVQGWTQGLAAD